MLPDLDEESGYLPPGTHVATIDEVVQQFETPGHGQRLRISNSLRELFQLVAPFALGIYIDGSYTTSKISPNDADVIVVLPDNFDALSMNAHRLQEKRKKTRELDISWYRITADARRLEEKIAWFCHDRNGNSKGIVNVEICR